MFAIAFLISGLLVAGGDVEVPNPFESAASRIGEVSHTLVAQGQIPEPATDKELDSMAGERLYEELMVAANRNKVAGDPGGPKAIGQFNKLVDRYNQSGIDNPDFPDTVLRVGEGTSWDAVHAYLDEMGPYEA